MEQLIINGKTLQYVGMPLVAYIHDTDGWAGRSNFLASNEQQKTKIDLFDLDNCFHWMKEWSHELDYVSGYVLDYSTKTVYYDKQEVLEHLELVFFRRNEEGYFENFVLKDFTD